MKADESSKHDYIAAMITSNIFIRNHDAGHALQRDCMPREMLVGRRLIIIRHFRAHRNLSLSWKQYLARDGPGHYHSRVVIKLIPRAAA